jgi:hypothetical protein
MEITLEHHFTNTCYDIDELLNGVNKMSTFLKRLDTQSQKNPNMWDPDKYKGDGFEAFVEALIKLSPADKRINIQNYHPTTVDEKGVDGIGESLDTPGGWHTVQAKYRRDTQRYITEGKDHIAMFPAYSFAKYKPTYMTLFTSAKGLHPNLEGFEGTVNVIGYEQLRKFVDNNTGFWANFYNLMVDK